MKNFSYLLLVGIFFITKIAQADMGIQNNSDTKMEIMSAAATLVSTGAHLCAEARHRNINLHYNESEILENETLPCNADLYATKESIINITFRDTCETNPNISISDMIQAILTIGGNTVFCENQMCKIDLAKDIEYNRRGPRR